MGAATPTDQWAKGPRVLPRLVTDPHLDTGTCAHPDTGIIGWYHWDFSLTTGKSLGTVGTGWAPVPVPTKSVGITGISASGHRGHRYSQLKGGRCEGTDRSGNTAWERTPSNRQNPVPPMPTAENRCAASDLLVTGTCAQPVPTCARRLPGAVRGFNRFACHLFD